MRHVLALLLLVVLTDVLPAQAPPVLAEMAPADALAIVRLHFREALRRRGPVLTRWGDRLVFREEFVSIRPDAGNFRVVWRIGLAPGVRLADVAEARAELEAWLREEARINTAFADAEKLRFAVEFDEKIPAPRPVLPLPPPREQPPSAERPPVPPPPLPAPRPRVARRPAFVWVFVPSSCGSCGSGSFVAVRVPSSAVPVTSSDSDDSSGSSGSSSESGPARMPPADVPVDDGFFTSTGNGSNTLTEIRNGRNRRGIDISRMQPSDAIDLFWQGYSLYWKQEYGEAREYLVAATRLNGEDARFWYYRALTEVALGNDSAADGALNRAVTLHHQGLPRTDVIGRSLERVQGPTRMMLREAYDSR
jgi:hypothetical protein